VSGCGLHSAALGWRAFVKRLTNLRGHKGGNSFQAKVWTMELVVSDGRVIRQFKVT